MSVRQRPEILNAKGQPAWIVDYKDEHGRRKQLKTDALTKKDAQLIEASILSKIEVAKREGVSVDSLTPTTFSAFVDNTYLPWKKAQLGGDLRTSTYNRIVVIAGHLKDHFGPMTLSAIKVSTIDAEFKAMGKKDTIQGRPPGAGELRNRMVRMGEIMDLAIKKELLRTANPARYADRKSYKPKPKHFITPAEEEKILNACPDWLRPIVAVGINSGMREGELAALEWAHIKDGLIYVPAENAKTGQERFIPINAAIEAALAPLRARRLAEGSPAYVFWNAALEKHYSANSICCAFTRVAAKLGIPATFHCTRVAFVTSARNEGKIKDAHLMEITGHKTPSQLEHYTKIQPGHLKGVTEGLRSKETATQMQHDEAGKGATGT